MPTITDTRQNVHALLGAVRRAEGHAETARTCVHEIRTGSDPARWLWLPRLLGALGATVGALRDVRRQARIIAADLRVADSGGAGAGIAGGDAPEEGLFDSQEAAVAPAPPSTSASATSAVASRGGDAGRQG
jgi:hypothetical protein